MQKHILIVAFLFFLIPFSHALSQSYLCEKTLNQTNTTLIKEIIKSETEQSLSEEYLSQYIKYPESYCNVTKKANYLVNPQTPTIIYQSNPNDDSDVNSSAYTIVPTGISIDNLKYYDDRNAKGLLKFMSIIFIMSPSDPNSKNQNYYI